MARALAAVIGALATLSAAPGAMAQLPSAGDVTDLLRSGPGTIDHVADWADRACGSLTGEACASHLELQPRWGQFAGAPGPSVVVLFSTGNTLGSTGVAVVTRVAPGQLRLQIPQSTRVQSAMMRQGRLRLVIDVFCRSRGSSFGTFGNPRLQQYSMRGTTIVRTGRRARC